MTIPTKESCTSILEALLTSLTESERDDVATLIDCEDLEAMYELEKNITK